MGKYKHLLETNSFQHYDWYYITSIDEFVEAKSLTVANFKLLAKIVPMMEQNESVFEDFVDYMFESEFATKLTKYDKYSIFLQVIVNNAFNDVTFARDCTECSDGRLQAKLGLDTIQYDDDCRVEFKLGNLDVVMSDNFMKHDHNIISINGESGTGLSAEVVDMVLNSITDVGVIKLISKLKRAEFDLHLDAECDNCRYRDVIVFTYEGIFKEMCKFVGGKYRQIKEDEIFFIRHGNGTVVDFEHYPINDFQVYMQQLITSIGKEQEIKKEAIKNAQQGQNII